MPANSDDMRRRGRIGAYTTLSRFDPTALTERARQVYRDSFIDHSACGLCGHPAPVAAAFSDAERTRRAEMLRRAHMARLTRRAVLARRIKARRAKNEGDSDNGS